MGIPATTLRGDLTGTAFGGVPTWTDYTASLETGQDGQPITLTWGKQDEDDAPQPRTCEFILDNTDGRFTTGASIITTAHQFNVQVTVNGSTYDLFTGFVEDVEVLFTGTTHAQVKVSCVDLTGRLEQVELRSMVEHEMLADSPSYLYPLSEDAPSTSAADSSPNQLDPAVRLDSKYGANILEFGTSMNGMFDGVNGVRFGEENLSGGATAPATVLSLPSTAFVPTSGAHTLECWYLAPDAPPSGSAFILDQGAPSSGDRVSLFVNSSGQPAYSINGGGWTAIAAGTRSICDGRVHHLVATLASDRVTARLYVDGALVDTDTAGGLTDFLGIKDFFVGGIVRYGSNAGASNASGAVALVAGYASELTAATILRHYQAGVGTGPVESTALRVGRLMHTYHGLTNLVDPGIGVAGATMAAQRTLGVSLQAALQKVADTEGGPVFAKADGKLTLQFRNTRYWPASAFTLTCGTDINPDVVVRKDRLGLVNDQTVSRDGGASQRVIDQTSITAYGRKTASLEVASSTDFDALQNAAWKVATGKTPVTRLSEVTLDLMTMASTSLLQSVLQATISTAFTLTGQPTQTPADLTATGTGLFVEGGSMRMGVTAWELTFFTSPLAASGASFAAGGSTPNLPNTLRADSSASQRTKLDAGLKIPF